MNLSQFLIVGLGGFMGSIARFITVRSVDDRIQSLFPYGTLTVNIAGSFLLGILYGLVTRKFEMPENVRLFFGTGFCGGFTTFSAFALENLNLLNQKMILSSLVYITLSIILGVLAVWGGYLLGRLA